jgi:hypothetical protein
MSAATIDRVGCEPFVHPSQALTWRRSSGCAVVRDFKAYIARAPLPKIRRAVQARGKIPWEGCSPPQRDFWWRDLMSSCLTFFLVAAVHGCTTRARASIPTRAHARKPWSSSPTVSGDLSSGGGTTSAPLPRTITYPFACNELTGRTPRPDISRPVQRRTSQGQGPGAGQRNYRLSQTRIQPSHLPDRL